MELNLLKITGEVYKILDTLTDSAAQQFAVVQLLNTLVQVRAVREQQPQEGVKHE